MKTLAKASLCKTLDATLRNFCFTKTVEHDTEDGLPQENMYQLLARKQQTVHHLTNVALVHDYKEPTLFILPKR